MGYIVTRPVTAMALGKSWHRGGRIGDGELPTSLCAAMLAEGVIVPAPGIEIDATSAAAMLAVEGNVDLAVVEGTGKDGRITKADVEHVVKGAQDD
jgi:pyruvate/2-oxoglutarate dehydrogenase complex dihydrolipoamide acyltransferase (E2) component